MICKTTKEGTECFFMSKSGCTYNGGTCLEVVEKCEGCEKIMEIEGKKYCLLAPQPDLKWNVGDCNLATHIKREVKKEQVINALKASKRKAAGK